MKKFIIPAFIICLAACKCNTEVKVPEQPQQPVNQIANITYDVVNIYPHDVKDYTEGLELHNGFLYESTGNYGESLLKKSELKTGKSLQQQTLAKEFFGEGITILNNKIYQLTYKENKAFVYDLVTFKKLKEFDWSFGEGWGLTNDGKQLIASTGGSNIYFIDPETFVLNKTLPVTGNSAPVNMINELEYVNGSIYANIFETDYIIRINPETGAVTGRADITGILEKVGKPAITNPESVLNGIAYDSAKQSFYITGKNWPALLEVKFH